MRGDLGQTACGSALARGCPGAYRLLRDRLIDRLVAASGLTPLLTLTWTGSVADWRGLRQPGAAPVWDIGTRSDLVVSLLGFREWLSRTNSAHLPVKLSHLGSGSVLGDVTLIGSPQTPAAGPADRFDALRVQELSLKR